MTWQFYIYKYEMGAVFLVYDINGVIPMSTFT